MIKIFIVRMNAVRTAVLLNIRGNLHLKAATEIGDSILETYEKALDGIRATQRGEKPRQPEDPYLLRDAAIVLLDCGLRPEECHRLRWEHYRDDTIYVPHGKTINARREIPLSERAREVFERRRGGESRGCSQLRPLQGTSGNQA